MVNLYRRCQREHKQNDYIIITTHIILYCVPACSIPMTRLRDVSCNICGRQVQLIPQFRYNVWKYKEQRTNVFAMSLYICCICQTIWCSINVLYELVMSIWRIDVKLIVSCSVLICESLVLYYTEWFTNHAYLRFTF